MGERRKNVAIGKFLLDSSNKEGVEFRVGNRA